MKIGQPKLSERKIQTSGIFVPPTAIHSKLALVANDDG